MDLTVHLTFFIRTACEFCFKCPWHRKTEEIVKEILIKLITFMVRQSHHERNQYITVRPEPVEGLNQRFLNEFLNNPLLSFRIK